MQTVTSMGDHNGTGVMPVPLGAGGRRRTRRAPAILFLAALTAAPWGAVGAARADSLALGPYRAALRSAATDLRACQVLHALPAGRYVVALTVNALGKVERVEIESDAADLERAAASCLEAAFTRVAYPASVLPPLPSSGESRRSFAPPSHLPARRSRRAFRSVEIHWPFVLP